MFAFMGCGKGTRGGAHAGTRGGARAGARGGARGNFELDSFIADFGFCRGLLVSFRTRVKACDVPRSAFITPRGAASLDFFFCWSSNSSSSRRYLRFLPQVDEARGHSGKRSCGFERLPDLLLPRILFPLLGSFGSPLSYFGYLFSLECYLGSFSVLVSFETSFDFYFDGFSVGRNFILIIFLGRGVWVRVGVGVVIVVALMIPEELPCLSPVGAGGRSDFGLCDIVFLINTPGLEAVIGAKLIFFDTFLQEGGEDITLTIISTPPWT